MRDYCTVHSIYHFKNITLWNLLQHGLYFLFCFQLLLLSFSYSFTCFKSYMSKKCVSSVSLKSLRRSGLSFFVSSIFNPAHLCCLASLLTKVTNSFPEEFSDWQKIAAIGSSSAHAVHNRAANTDMNKTFYHVKRSARNTFHFHLAKTSKQPLFTASLDFVNVAFIKADNYQNTMVAWTINWSQVKWLTWEMLQWSF